MNLMTSVRYVVARIALESASVLWHLMVRLDMIRVRKVTEKTRGFFFDINMLSDLFLSSQDCNHFSFTVVIYASIILK